jgi:nitrilase
MKIAAIQAAPVFLDAAATTKKALELIREAARNGAELVAFPETFLSGYPIWLGPLASNLSEQERKNIYRVYLEGAVYADGPELASIADEARRLGLFVYMGFIERPRETPLAYCALAPIHPERGILTIHRKVKPTEFERLLWAEGDAHGMRVHEWNGVRVGGLCCAENFQPLLRHTLYAQGEQIHVSVWPGQKRSTVEASCWTANEGRVFVLAAAGVIDHSNIPANFPLKDRPELEKGFKAGGSIIVGPKGDTLAGPVVGEETILYADIDPAETLTERARFDPAGHYMRPDLFKLSVAFSRHAPMHHAPAEQ